MYQFFAFSGTYSEGKAKKMIQICPFAKNSIPLQRQKQTITYNAMDTKKKLRMEQNALKVYIFACGFGLTIYAGLLCFGFRSPLAEWLSMTAAFGLLTYGAYAFRLCWVAYCFIAYMYVIRCCIILQTIGFWGEWLDVAHWVAFIVGLFLCGLFIGRCFMSNCGEDENE